ncbi:hypothetical protein CALCODRAFT_102236 [Calocera cornea HHB12733]|uniref:Uncharacterized protein n=1 Tax=Calocera cornea HHB12733 TaxID=1353952 RepID=A0A165D523_9BASI|nr:hypothetical protein CALCODRAFT_102236 [Calocera cornea HHB12733]
MYLDAQCCSPKSVLSSIAYFRSERTSDEPLSPRRCTGLGILRRFPPARDGPSTPPVSGHRALRGLGTARTSLWQTTNSRRGLLGAALGYITCGGAGGDWTSDLLRHYPAVPASHHIYLPLPLISNQRLIKPWA